MDFERLLRFVFVSYCTTVGVSLVVIPWTPGWDQMLALLDGAGLRLLELPIVRGGITGFGLVHLVWGLHDLRRLLSAGEQRSGRSPAELPGAAPGPGRTETDRIGS